MDIPGYTTKRVIGEGGMSTVYLAVQQSLEREVALKIMSDRLVSDESFRKRFLKEGKIIAQLHHPRIVTIHDFGISGDIYYICQEYLPGGTLADEIKHGIEIPRALFIVKGIADALEYAHSRGFVHRDIKPQNILFRNDRLRSPVLTDFGIAKAITPEDTKLTIVNAFCGSPAYASPEQAKGLELDGRSDIYSLGILIFQMLSGHLPYDAKDPVSLGIRHIIEPVPKLPEHLATRFQPLLDRCLAKDPEDRFAHAEELIQAIRAIEQSSTDFPTAYTTGATQEIDPSSLATVVLRDTATGAGHADTKRPVQTAQSALPDSRIEATAPTPPPATSQQGKKVAYVLVGAGLAAVILGVTYRVMLSDHTPTLQKQTPPPLAEADEPTGPGHLSVPVAGAPIPEDNLQARVTKLLGSATRYLESGQLFSPEGSNAYEAYKDVLAIEPNNLQATTGLDDLFRRQIALIEKNIAGDNTEQAEEQIERLREYAPAKEAHERLSQELQARKDRKKKEFRINSLLSTAAAHVSAGRFFEPSGYNAFDTYEAAREAGADENLVARRVNNLLERQKTLAEQALVDNRFADSLDLIDAALRADPANEGFLQLRAKVRQQLAKAAEEAATTRQVSQWLATAQQLLKDGKLVAEKGDSAYSLFRRVLAIDPGNLQAAAGISDLLARLTAQVAAKSDAGDIEGAQALIEQGLKVDNENKQLKKLDLDVKRQQVRISRINNLMVAAERSLQSGQLFSPQGSNAYDTYKEILAIDQKNQQASAGLEEVIRRQVSLVERNIAKGDVVGAEKQVDVLRQVVPNDQSIASLSQALQARKDQIRTEAQINSLLSTAETHETAGRLFEPDTQNAFDAYQAARKAGADENLIAERVNRIFERQAAIAEQALNDSDYSGSLDLIDAALRAAPDSEVFIQLRARVRQRQAQALQEEEAARQTTQRLNQARALLAEGRFFAERGDSAYSLYQRVLAADPGNAEAEAGMRELLEALQKEIQRRLDIGDIPEAQQLIAQGLRVDPANKDLRKMQSAAENQLSKDNRVRELLVAADNHRRALRIVTPRKQNAFETYKQVLALDPNNSEAKQGIAQLVRIEERLARSAYRKGLLQASLQRIDAGLSIDAKDPALLALRQQVENQIRADQRAQQPPLPKVVRERPTQPATNGSSPTAKPLTPTHPGKSTSEAPAPMASPAYAPTEGSATTAKPAPQPQPAEAVDALQPPPGTKSEDAPARIRTFPSY